MENNIVPIRDKMGGNQSYPPTDKNNHRYSVTLIYCSFIAGLCSIIYELLIATTASYFLGDSVKYFSLTIGLYMASMGIGSFVSKYAETNILQKFISAEICLGLLGGLSIPLLYFSYSASPDMFLPVYMFLTVGIGFLIGLEIPFLTRLMGEYHSLKLNIAYILSVDYLGALIATLAFPFFLLPTLGVYQSSLAFGVVNMSIGFVMLWVFKDKIQDSIRSLKAGCLSGTVIMIFALAVSGVSLQYWDQSLYADRIVYNKQSPYQKVILTKHKDDVRLFLDGNLQFSSVDEYRYHEALVHIPLSLHPTPVKRVLLLGAGDGLAVRELLKYNNIQEIVLVDLDKTVTDLARSNPHVLAVNQNSLASPKVKLVLSDAFTYLKDNHHSFDFIIADLPDPNNEVLSRLYSKQFYTLLKTNLNPDGLFVTQATSPYFAKQAFWCINKTIQTAGFEHTYPYHVEVPSFGDWGFVIGSSQTYDVSHPHLAVNTRFLSPDNFSNGFHFDKDTQLSETVEVNHMDKPRLLAYYLKGWEYYVR